jgi:protein-disulfide isomerase
MFSRFDDRIQQTQIMPDDWILGDAEAPVTMLEYGDFECPYCAMARPVLEALVVDYPDTIRLVYRHFPITNIHPHAALAAEAAEAAGAQGRFWDMHDLLFANQDRLEFEDLRAYAREIGLQRTRFDQEMIAHVYQNEVRQDFRRGIQDGVNGTPSIFINGLRYDGPRDYGSILAAIQSQVPV